MIPCVIAGCHEGEQDSLVEEMNRVVSEGRTQEKIMWIQEINFHCVEKKKKLYLITDFLRSCNLDTEAMVCVCVRETVSSC